MTQLSRGLPVGVIDRARPGAIPDFDSAPFVVIWETTQACDLACRHCRASARRKRDPLELSTDEAKRLIDEIRSMGNPLFILTGGDALKRPDILELVAYAREVGLRVALTPSGTPLMTEEILVALRDAGLARLAVSLDGASASVHDGFRRVAGSFDWSVKMLRVARDIGLSTQVNTSVTRDTIAQLQPMLQTVGDLGVALWSVFLVVPTGRAKADQLPSAQEVDVALRWLHERSREVPFDIKTTAAPFYRRVALQATAAAEIPHGRGVTDGCGFVFVSHRGEIFPSGFLPLSAGNVRTASLATVYREHPMFRALRTPAGFRGKCGVCEFNRVCGGSRARAYAMTGDYLESDPSCSYIPARYAEMATAEAQA